MSGALVLLDASAFWRLRSPQLAPDRRREVADWITRRLVVASTLLLLETRAGRDLPPADPGESRGSGSASVPSAEPPSRRAAEPPICSSSYAQLTGTSASRRSTIAAVAEDHGASTLHYDADSERLGANTDLAVRVDALAPLGSLL